MKFVFPAPGYIAVAPLQEDEGEISYGKVAIDVSSPYSRRYVVKAVSKSGVGPYSTVNHFHLDVGDVVLADFGNAVTAEHEDGLVMLIRYDQIVAWCEEVNKDEVGSSGDEAITQQ